MGQSVDTLAVQVAATVGAKIIVTAATSEELNLYADCDPHVGERHTTHYALHQLNALSS